MIRNSADTVSVLSAGDEVTAVVGFFTASAAGWREQWPVPSGAAVVRIQFARADGSSSGVEVGPGLVRYWRDGDPIAKK